MSLIPHSVFPRSSMDMDKWTADHHKWALHTTPHALPSTLEIFDPFDELDSMMGRNLQWLNKPEFISQLPKMPHVPQKYRITLDVAGYSPNSIKHELHGLRLTVTGKEDTSNKHEGDDFHVKSFKKTYTLPVLADTTKLVSFVTAHGQLVIEMPLKESELHKNEDLFPRITDTPTGKQMSLTFGVPEKIHPSHVMVSIKDHDLVVKAEDTIEKPDSISKFFYYKRTTLPVNTVWAQLKCTYDDHRITVTAPLDMDWKLHKQVPIEYKQSIKPVH